MQKLFRKYYSPPALRLNIMIICEVVLLLALSLGVMLYFSRKALKEEVVQNAEQTLEGMARHIDNVLLDVEQSAGNVYLEMMMHLDKPERMQHYCAKVVECNPYVVGCAIAFKPNYYPGRERFMTYVHHKGGLQGMDAPGALVYSDKFGKRPYTEQVWYTLPMTTNRVYWTDPLEEEEDEGKTLSLCIPITDEHQEPIGVMAVDLPIVILTQAVLTSEPSNGSYSVLVGSDGSFIIHPDSKVLIEETVHEMAQKEGNASMREVTEAMLAGQTGYQSIHANGKDLYVFYKPFERAKVPGRSNEKHNWSVAAIYPKAEIYDSFNEMLWATVLIALVSLSLFYMFIRVITRQQLRSLKTLTLASQRIAEGNYSEPIAESKRDHEIGHLQQDMRLMQQALATKESEADQLIETLEERNKVLRKAFKQSEEASHMKTTYLHYISNQMTLPSEIIDHNVTNLCNNYKEANVQEASRQVEAIKKQSKTILELLNHMMKAADNESGKEEKL